MAITIVVEDGTGLPTANAYLSAAEADAILCVNPTLYARWTALSAADQDAYLVWASGYIDDYVSWNGTKTVEDSGLRWPRECVYDRDGILIGSNEIPDQLKEAVAQLSMFLVGNETAATGSENNKLPEGVQRVKADVVEVEFFEDGAKDSRSGSDLMPINIRYLISGLGTVITGRQRVGRAIR